jgi:UDP-GlcNAc:undecaprenyl-phosphate GlcNAc-1-phosphate transferase
LVTGLGFGVLPILLVSIADDIRSIPAKWKFLAHLLGAVFAVSFDISLAPTVHLFGSALQIGWIAAPLSVLWIVGVTNAFNIIDGLDGLSTGLALISALSMAAVFALVGQPGMAGVSLVLAGALSGFLPFNLHPARLFLGDTGATAIGFCLAAFALRGGSTLSTGFAALLPVFILGLPIADTLIAMLRRTLHRLEHRAGGVFVADRNHIHHRLLALGVDHAKAVLVLYAAGLVFAVAALASVFVNAREAAFILSALILAGIVGVQRLGYDEFAFLRRGTVLRVYELPGVKRGFFVVFVDIALAFLAAYVAIGLKTDTWRLSIVGDSVLEIATTLAPITVAVFSWRGMYRGSWRVAGLVDLTKVLVAVGIATPAGAIVLGIVSANHYVLSLFGIYGVVNLLMTAAIRASYVILENTKLRSSNQGVPVLIYGAGRGGVVAVRELFQNPAAGLCPVGFIDDDANKRDRIVSGLPVFGAGRDLEVALATTGAEGIVISTAKIAQERVDRAAEMCRRVGCSLFRLDISVQRLEGEAPAAQPVADPVAPGLPEPFGAEAPMIVFDLEASFGSQPCPSCRTAEVHRSKSKNIVERLRKLRTDKRLYRCDACGWRGWLVPLDFARQSQHDLQVAPDLASLDTAFPDAGLAGAAFARPTVK